MPAAIAHHHIPKGNGLREYVGFTLMQSLTDAKPARILVLLGMLWLQFCTLTASLCEDSFTGCYASQQQISCLADLLCSSVSCHVTAAALCPCCALPSAASHKACPTSSIAFRLTPTASHHPLCLLHGSCWPTPIVVAARCRQPAATSRGVKRRQSCVSARLSFT